MEIAVERHLYGRACRALYRWSEAHGFIYNQPSNLASGYDTLRDVLTLRSGDRVLATYRYDARRDRLRRIGDK